MKVPSTPENELERQKALDESGLLDQAQDERFDRITRIACQLFSVPIALVSLIDRDRQWFKSCQGLSVSETPRSISFCGHTIHSDKPLIVENALNDERFADNPLVLGHPDIRFYAGTALKTTDGLRLGTVCIIDQNPRHFSDKDARLLIDLGRTIETIIAADADVRTTYSTHEKILLESEKRARLFIEATGVGTWQWNVQTGETIFNERWAEMVGYTLEELFPISIDTWTRLVHPEDIATSDAALKRHFSGENAFYDCKARMLHKLGHWVWVHVRGQVFDWTPEGEPLLMYGTHTNITSEMHAQEALKTSRDELNSLISNMPGITYRCLPDTKWTMLYISTQIENISGYKAEEFIDNACISYADLIYPEDSKRVNEAVHSAINDGNRWHIQYRILTRDNEWCWVEERGRAIFDEASQRDILEGFIIDVTREHETEISLSKYQNALMLLNELALNTEQNIDQRLIHALHVARDYLDMDVAILSQIETDVYTVKSISSRHDIDIKPGKQLDLGLTWCQLLFSGEESELFIANIQSSNFSKHPCNEYFPIGAYIGVPVFVEGNVYGTLNFSRNENRNDFDQSERLFVGLMARWIGGLLESTLSSERLYKLFNQLPGTVYQFRRYPNGHVTFPFSSENILMLYGISSAQAKISAQPAFEKIHPDDLEQTSASIEASASTMTPWQAIYRVRKMDGTYRWVLGQSQPERLSDGSILWHGYINDIDAQEQARQALERNEKRLRGLFDFSPIGIALIDFETGQFIDLNAALLLPTGYTREEFLRLSYWELTPKKYQAEEEKALFDMQQTGRYGPFEKEYIRKDGSRYPIRLQGILSTDPDGRKVIWSLIEDISEPKRLEKMKDQFIATVSHELRTPLTSINGSISLLLGGVAGQLSERGMSLLENAARNGKRLTNLINDLLDIEKLVAGKMPMRMTVQPLAPLLDEAIDSVMNYAHQGMNKILVDHNCNGVRVHVDGARLIQALNNLLSNAIKFSPDGKEVHVITEVIGDDLLISVRDHGSGIDPEFQKYLFKRFSQGDSSDTRRLPGTGLGLAITREICDQMGGSVHFNNAKDGGSIFYIRLPVVKS
ncbi:MAG: PAS domain-containing protein [Methylophaga sp.]|nr:PAS domain-containing protein [Methylophaga sp.]